MATRFNGSLAIFCLFHVYLISVAGIEEESLPGWLGETYHRGRKYRQSQSGKRMMRGTDSNFVDPSKVIQLSWKPRAFLYPGFLSAEECDHIVNLAKNDLSESMVVDNESGAALKSEIRTSAGTFIDDSKKDDVVRRIEDRIASWTFVPRENGEAIQVLRYNYNQRYDAHYDYFHDKQNIQQGGHRMATVLMYLSDVESGGETVFPNSVEDTPKDDSWSSCAKAGIATKPRKGDALLFFSVKPDATPDEYSLHAGCPVLKGVKWSATKWLHVSTFQPEQVDPNQCENLDPNCKMWAEAGECEKNKGFMIGEGGYIGTCRMACNACNSHLVNQT